MLTHVQRKSHYKSHKSETHRINQQLGAEETHAAEDFHDLRDEADVKDRLGQLDVSEVAWAFGHVTCIRKDR